ncbi:hypothetical protein FHL15_002247 [Xylaria flabelliformis]|uniref:Uncharacterized protein n=1 Tax=Xylaria flabelliformis TaxID=2512241 RepID=A0A553I9R1_9PEZI|nr:hypothetical protein FHL15_002247 [Xylaria flabelliformis]
MRNDPAWYTKGQRVEIRSKRPYWYDDVEGFFNNIPGIDVWIHHNNLVSGVNLVSSQWVDWEAYLKLQSANGELIKCRGYINSNWIPGNLEGRYVMEEVFVVDAVFTTSKKPRIQREFVFCQSTFTENSRAELTSIEKRCLISNLNPTVFRHVELGWPPIGALWIKKPKKKPAPEPTFEERMMMESNMRDGVDTGYEQNMKRYRGDEETLQKIEMKYDLE